MLFEETDTEESGNSQSDMSSLDDGVSRMKFESTSSEEVTDDGDDDVDSQVWSEVDSESDTEFSEDYGRSTDKFGSWCNQSYRLLSAFHH